MRTDIEGLEPVPRFVLPNKYQYFELTWGTIYEVVLLYASFLEGIKICSAACEVRKQGS
jgi:hypothetical protein